ncbi:uncharacterized protein SCHCODRAFT_02615834 [Schizophyllum commune H4-8]|nr:uncharacterized protein SCHCODRAFT_02615834 [Schizophyllum commune H4-8]KAI5896790.1 hypothetical protein SCHCODRAFT_02615834 [Schizophyllum commune H4-8]
MSEAWWNLDVRSPTEVSISIKPTQPERRDHYPSSKDLAGVSKVEVRWFELREGMPPTLALRTDWVLTHLEIELNDYSSHDKHPPLSAVLGAIMFCKDTLRVCIVDAAIASIDPATLARPAVAFPALESLTLHDEGACLALLISAPNLQYLFIEGNPTCDGGAGIRYISEEQALFRLKTLLDRSGDCPRLRSLVLFNSDLDKGDLVALLRRLPSLTELDLIEIWDAEATPAIFDALTRKPEDPASLMFLPALTSLTICDGADGGSTRHSVWSWYKLVVRSRLIPMTIDGTQLACLQECHTVSEHSLGPGVRGGEGDITLEHLDEIMSEDGSDVDSWDMSSVESNDEAEA